MRRLVLTLDYELYGDGSGDVFRHMVDPTERILEICEQNGVRISVFFEVMEYIRLKALWESGRRMGYKKDPIAAIERQIKSLAEAGHDVQLHVHPQWFGAEYVDGQWKVDLGNWRLADFSGPPGYGIQELLRESKETLEALVGQVIPNYRCRILRAGAYNIVPSGAVYRAMVGVGLEVDSSVYPGGREMGDLSRYDFRAASLNLDYWPADPIDFCRSCHSSDVVEFPIFALTRRRVAKLSMNRVRSYLQRPGRRASNSGFQGGRAVGMGALAKIGDLFRKEALTWDFCLFDFHTHKKFFRYIDGHLPDRSVFILIGHPKGFTSARGLRRMLRYGKKLGYDFVPLKDVVEDTRR